MRNGEYKARLESPRMHGQSLDQTTLTAPNLRMIDEVSKRRLLEQLQDSPSGFAPLLRNSSHATVGGQQTQLQQQMQSHSDASPVAIAAKMAALATSMDGSCIGSFHAVSPHARRIRRAMQIL